MNISDVAVIYVVTKDTGEVGDAKNVLVTTDADEAKRVCDEEYRTENADTEGRRCETFIEVWSDEELRYVTREHPGDDG